MSRQGWGARSMVEKTQRGQIHGGDLAPPQRRGMVRRMMGIASLVEAGSRKETTLGWIYIGIELGPAHSLPQWHHSRRGRGRGRPRPRSAVGAARRGEVA